MFKAMNPEGVCPPFRHYVHSIEVPPNARWLVVSGQVGTLPDGTIPEGVEAQTEAAWNNVVKILEANGMGIEDIVMVTQYLTQDRGPGRPHGDPRPVPRRPQARPRRCSTSRRWPSRKWSSRWRSRPRKQSTDRARRIPEWRRQSRPSS